MPRAENRDGRGGYPFAGDFGEESSGNVNVVWGYNLTVF